MKILIIRFSSIGDIVFTSPVVRCVKEQLPNAEVHFCTKEKFAPLVVHNPYIDKIHFLKGSVNELIGSLKNENFDYILDLHNNIRTAIIKLRLSGKPFTYKKYPFQHFLYTRFKINKLPGTHVIDRFFEAASGIGVVNDGKGINVFIDQQDDVNVNAAFPGIGSDYTAIVIGASANTKKMPTAKLIELCKAINQDIILVGGQEDHAKAGEVLSVFSDIEEKKRIYNACGRFTINQSASIVKQASLVVGHDTGLTHMAAAFHQKIYSVWGNTVPEFGMYPYVKESIFIENKTLACRPCSKLGSKKCPEGHFKCMNDLQFSF